MAGGDCYEASFKAFMHGIEEFDHNEWVLVHAMREHMGKGAEWWGGHAFLLNKKTNQVIDHSISARNNNDGEPMVTTLDKVIEMWDLRVDQEDMYVEYTRGEMVEKALETGHYGSWDLPFENWEDEGYGDYMNMFQQKYMPRTRKFLEDAGAGKVKDIRDEL